MPIAASRPGDLSEDGPAYEVMYLLDAEDSAIPTLRSGSAPLGDSLVVVGGDGLWNIHVHVDDVGAAIEAGIEAGRPHRVAGHPLRRAAEPAEAAPRHGPGRTRRAVSSPWPQDPGCRRCSARPVPASCRAVRAALLDRASCSTAIRATGHREVIVLPNDADSIAVGRGGRPRRRATRASAPRSSRPAPRSRAWRRSPSTTPGRSFDDDVVQMTSAAGHARHGAVTIAAKDAMTMAGPCRVGDTLGVVEGDFAVVGDDARRRRGRRSSTGCCRAAVRWSRS